MLELKALSQLQESITGMSIPNYVIPLRDEQDYICLTDMVRDEGGSDHIRNWMRNRNTVEFIGLWETLHNPDFKPVEFDTFRKQACLSLN